MLISEKEFDTEDGFQTTRKLFKSRQPFKDKNIRKTMSKHSKMGL